jgi:2-hydroxy-3-oxopropionate reductase
MAINLIRAGFDVVVASRSPAPVERLVEEGARALATAREIAAATEVVIAVLPDTPDMALVMGGPDGTAGRRASWSHRHRFRVA